MKEFLTVAGVPTAAYGIFSDEAAAAGFLDTMTPPYVIKTDGLAAGKGVLVTSDLDEAKRDITDKLSGKSFGVAGRTIVLEEALVGDECSLHVLCDGTDVVVLASAQDYKRVGDQDAGANTGGMGAYAPMATLSDADVSDVMRDHRRADTHGTTTSWHRLSRSPLRRTHDDRNRDPSCSSTTCASGIPRLKSWPRSTVLGCTTCSHAPVRVNWQARVRPQTARA